ncbi:MAG: RNA methyltransferase [Oscillospiraceae bacterium]|nr:RNA methyltransferase [Oscillospiraceae bacterium]
MAEIIEIKDISAPELDVYARLTQAQLKNRQNPEKGMFIAEGTKVIEIALKNNIEPLSLLVEKKHIEGKANKLIRCCPDIPVYTAERDVLEKLTGFELTRGVLCAMRRPHEKKPEEICRSARRLAVLENIVDASNLGAIFRNAAALGIDGIILSPSCCDPLYRKAVRTSMGTVFQLPWCRFSGCWPDDGIAFLRKLGFKTAALALDAQAISLDNPILSGIEKLAVILGTEGSGLDSKTINACDYSVYIPMYSGVDSLNVASAAAVAFWQLRVK